MKHRQLEAFRTVMNVGSITGAAKVLSISQPAVSRLIGALEHELKFRLFDRQGNRIIPTHEARRFFIEVDRAFLRLDLLEQAANSIRISPHGSIRIAVAPIIAHGIMPSVIAAFLKEYPETYVELSHGSRQRVIDSVASQVYDLAIEIPPINEPAISETPLLQQEIACVVPKDHELAGHSHLSIEDLRGFDLIMPEAGSVLREGIEEAFRKNSTGPRPRIQTTTQQSISELVAAGLGVGLMGSTNIGTELSARLTVIPIVPAIRVSYSLFTPKTRSPSRLAVAFIRVLKTFC